MGRHTQESQPPDMAPFVTPSGLQAEIRGTRDPQTRIFFQAEAALAGLALRITDALPVVNQFPGTPAIERCDDGDWHVQSIKEYEPVELGYGNLISTQLTVEESLVVPESYVIGTPSPAAMTMSVGLAVRPSGRHDIFYKRPIVGIGGTYITDGNTASFERSSLMYSLDPSAETYARDPRAQARQGQYAEWLKLMQYKVTGFLVPQS